MEENFSFGYWLKRQRLARDLRQAELAEQLGIAPITLRKIEADERRPSLQLIERVAAVFALGEQERATLLQVARAELSPAALPVPERAHELALAQPSAPFAATLPSGTVTFLFTDIAGSTQRWEQQPQAMRAALAQHDSLLRQAVGQHGGAVVKSTGDGLLAAFARADDALHAALAGQRALLAADWGALGLLPVRMALHSGAAEPEAGDYLGPTLNRTARILAAGHGSQILLSVATVELLRDQLPATVTLRDLGSYRLKDLTHPEQIHQAVVADLPADFPPLRTLDARRHNLPAQATALIGREREVAELCELLRDSAVRLVTLTGPGGTGKTRLAFQAAAELAEQFRDGVWFVNLAPISEAALVLPAIAQALDIREIGGRTLAETLADALREQHMLLLLDNLEQVLDAAPEVTTLLELAPQIRIIVTSRAILRLRAEHIVAVPPLGLPERQAPLTHTQLSQYDAVRLFIERTRAVRQDFEVTDANAPAIAEICWRLDGLPLAIELAAARMRLFSAEALLARLDQRLPLLTTGSRDLPARQQTLRATIEWSFALLGDAERTLFRQLGVFVGGWSLAGAVAVGQHDELETLDLLTALLDKSLIQQRDGPDGEPRFTMLETIREFALEQLQAHREAEHARRLHATYYLALAEMAEQGFTSAQRETWLARLDPEHENFRAALAWSQRATDNGALMLRLIGALWWFWYFRGHAHTGIPWLQQALGYITAHDLIDTRAKVLCGAGALADQRGDHVSARQWLTDSVALYRQLGNRRGLGYALSFLGLVEGHQFRLHASMAEHEESISLFQATGDRWGLALANQYLGEIYWFQGNLVSAGSFFEESANLFRELGDRWGLGRALGLVGFVVHDQGDDVRARALFEEGVAAIRAVGDTFVLAALRNKQGQVLRCLGECEQAIQCYNESIDLFQQLGNIQWTRDPLHNLGFMMIFQGDATQALAYFIESLRFAIETDDEEGMAICLAGLACVAQLQGQLERAVTLFAAADIQIKASGRSPDPAHLIDWEWCLTALRMQSDQSAFAAAWAAGRLLSLDEALAYAHDHR
jgi:predicted ATPase/class 3 adenylate cyclase